MLNDLSGSRDWKGPTIREISNLAGVSPATVDRVVNNRLNVKEKTRQKVMEAVAKLAGERSANEKTLDIRLFCVSGETFNRTMATAVEAANRSIAGMNATGSYVMTNTLDADHYAARILEESTDADGVVVIAYEHPAFNNAIRKLEAQGVPVVCLTTDLPSSRRSAYIGNDQYAAGSVAGQLIGKAIPREHRHILLVMSVAFRSQQEREMGFRRALRADFPHLRIEDRVVSDDSPDTTFEYVKRYIDSNGAPDAIYNLGGANRGVALAMEHADCNQETVFVGHELSAHSRTLLEQGIMDYVISHDVTAEIAAALRWISEQRDGLLSAPWSSPILVHTKYNCEL